MFLLITNFNDYICLLNIFITSMNKIIVSDKESSRIRIPCPLSQVPTHCKKKLALVFVKYIVYARNKSFAKVSS